MRTDTEFLISAAGWMFDSGELPPLNSGSVLEVGVRLTDLTPIETHMRLPSFVDREPPHRENWQFLGRTGRYAIVNVGVPCITSLFPTLTRGSKFSTLDDQCILRLSPDLMPPFEISEGLARWLPQLIIVWTVRRIWALRQHELQQITNFEDYRESNQQDIGRIRFYLHCTADLPE